MARRRRQSNAVRHGSEPLVVQEMDPIDDHPSLGRIRRARMAKVVRVMGKKNPPKVDVKVEVKS